MANPTALDLKIPDPAFFDDYDTGQYIPPPQAKEPDGKGKFKYVTFVATLPSEDGIKTRDDKGEYLKTREGFLKVVVEGLKLEGGYEIQQTHIGSAQYKKYDKDRNVTGQRNSSPFGDFLHANGVEARPGSAEEYEQLAKGLAGRQIQITGDWSAYDKDTQSNIAEKWEEFPDDSETPGAKLPYIEKGGKRFWARLSVKRWVSAI